MWNRTGQTEQENTGPPPQHKSHPAQILKHPSQPMQPSAQEKSCSSGKLFACMLKKHDDDDHYFNTESQLIFLYLRPT